MDLTDSPKTGWRATIILAMTAAVLLIALSIAAYVVIEDYKRQSLTLIKEAEEYELAKYRQMIKDRVNLTVGIISAARENAEKHMRSRFKERVDEAYNIIRTIYTAKKDLVPEEQLKEEIKEILRSIRWNNEHGYYFINAMDGTTVMHAMLPEFEGSNVLKTGSAAHQLIVQKLITKAREPGAGFVEYLSKDEQDDFLRKKKLSYIRTFEPYEWIIGTGGHPDDYLKEVKARVLETLKKFNLQNAPDQRLLIMDLSQGNDKYYGKFLFNDLDEISENQYLPRSFTGDNELTPIGKAIVRTAQLGHTYFQFSTKDKVSGQTDEKLCYCKIAKGWNWMVGSGFSLNKLKNTYEAKINIIKLQTERKTLYAIIGLIILSFTALAVISAIIFQQARLLKARQGIVQQLLDSQTNQVFLTNGSRLTACNSRLLKVIGYPTLNAFSKKHKCICEKFIDEKGFLPSTHGVWFDKLIEAEAKGEPAKVMLYDHSQNDIRIFMVNLGEEIIDKNYVVVSFTDITESESIKTELNRYLKIVDEYVQTSSTDLNGNITYVSEAFVKATGYSKEELLGQNHRIIRHPDMKSEVFTQMWETITKGETWRGEVKNKRKDGSARWTETYISPIKDDLDNTVGYTAIRHDITDKKKIETLTITDVMTNLSNRRHFNMISERETNLARRRGSTLAFLMVDVDNFKQYNDTYGHQAGDEALITVAEVMQTTFKRAHEYTFRLGGEEFGVLLCGVDLEEAQSSAEKLRQAIQNEGIRHAKNIPSGVLTVSIGVCFGALKQETTRDQIMLIADKALYRAKQSGRNTVVLTLLDDGN